MKILIQDYIELLRKRESSKQGGVYSKEILDMLIEASKKRLQNNGINEATIHKIEIAVSSGMDLDSILEKYPDKEYESTK